jgi:RHS repeat-associated protein
VTRAEQGQPAVVYANTSTHTPITAGAEAFTYGPDGVRRSDSQLTYEVDALGRVVAARAGATTLCELTYDALGRPGVVREAGAPPLILTWFGANVELESDGTQVVREYTRHPLTGTQFANHTAGATRYPLFDARANLIALVDTNGALLEAYRYDTFGAPTILDANGAPIPASMHAAVPVFGGQRYLPSIGRYLSTRRLMDPRHGVFLSADPLGYVSSSSLYAYAAQDPVDLIDPDGEFAFLAILAVVAIGAIVAGALNATRQEIQMAENPARRAQGFSWSELGVSMGIGAVAAPVLVFAPEVAIPLAALGIYSGANEIHRGNKWTGIFDIATSVAPFALKRVRGSVLGEGTMVGQARGLGPSTPWTGPAGRFARFNAVSQSPENFRPFLFGREVGPGIARPEGATRGGHAGVLIEDADGRLTLFHKGAKESQVPGWKLQANWRAPEGGAQSPPPVNYWFGPGRGSGPWSYRTIRVPSSTADAMSEYAFSRQGAPEEFVFYERSCSNFAADVLGVGGFRGLAPTGRTGASGLWQNWSTFAPAFETARNMTYSAGFWSSAHLSTPNVKCATGN